MKLKPLALLTASSLFIAACGNEQAKTAETATEKSKEASSLQADPTLSTLEQKLSYIVGTNMANQFQRDGIALDKAAFTLAVDDILSGQEPRLSQEEIQQTITTMQQQVQEKQAQVRQAESDKNKAEGLAYLEENAKKEGVVVTESGLQYKEVVSGDGATPTTESRVVVHYKGTLVDGTQFDSSYDRGEPIEFAVTGVISGWTEALQLMNVGDKFELTIPSDLAYGQRGSGPTIGPDATLLFEVELLEVK